MSAFKGLDKALKVIQKKVEDTLLTEVAEVVKNEELYHVYEDMYSRPTSGFYERRYEQGGMGDKNNYQHFVDVNGENSRTLVVTNTTQFNPYLNGKDASDGYSQNTMRESGLDGPINYGDGWNGIKYDYAEGEPATDYIENTIEDLNASKNHVKALRAGLRKRGLTVK